MAGHLDLPRSVVVVNKVDRASRDQVMAQLAAAAMLDAEAYFPVSARTGAGLDVLVDHLADRMPEGPPLFPEDTVRDAPEEQWVAELVREQLLAITHDELPYSIATRVIGVGGLTDHRRDHRRAGEPEGHGDRQGGPGPQAGR